MIVHRFRAVHTRAFGDVENFGALFGLVRRDNVQSLQNLEDLGMVGWADVDPELKVALETQKGPLDSKRVMHSPESSLRESARWILNNEDGFYLSRRSRADANAVERVRLVFDHIVLHGHFRANVEALAEGRPLD